MMIKSQGQRNYEKDIANAPNYPDGKKRPTWDEVGEAAQMSWNKITHFPIRQTLN
jgi:hypothetical protein